MTGGTPGRQTALNALTMYYGDWITPQLVEITVRRRI